MTSEERLQAFRALIAGEHEERIAAEELAAEQATDPWYRKWHLDHAARLRSMVYPWEQPAR